jgi:rubrerythrin
MSRRELELGSNRTGIASAIELAAEMIQGTREFPPSSEGDEQEIARVRNIYSQSADPLGSIPPPAMVPGQGASDVLLTQLVDKLGARLAFERSGVRLYTALISKLEAYGSFEGGPERTDLEHIRDQELEHFHMLTKAIERLGGDPTSITPSADVQATLSRGIMDVLIDPRTTFVQDLEAILVAELADNESWSTLSNLAEQAEEDELAAEFEEAEIHEREHLERVRAWLLSANGL